MQRGGAERDLDAALAALVEAALRSCEDGASPPAERAQLVARALAAGLRELIRAPLREALQAGYELGLRAAREGARPEVPPGTAPPSSTVAPAASAEGREAIPAPSAEPARSARGERGGHIVVDVGPFPSFSAVNRFHAAVAAAPGVAGAAIVAFRDGQLRLRVDHPHAAVLAATLQRLDLGPLHVLRAAPDRLELALGQPRPLPASPSIPPAGEPTGA